LQCETPGGAPSPAYDKLTSTVVTIQHQPFNRRTGRVPWVSRTVRPTCGYGPRVHPVQLGDGVRDEPSGMSISIMPAVVCPAVLLAVDAGRTTPGCDTETTCARSRRSSRMAPAMLRRGSSELPARPQILFTRAHPFCCDGPRELALTLWIPPITFSLLRQARTAVAAGSDRGSRAGPVAACISSGGSGGCPSDGEIMRHRVARIMPVPALFS
jgi:hypothetical protein